MLEQKFILVVDTMEYDSDSFGDILHKYFQLSQIDDSKPICVYIEIVVPLGHIRFEIDMAHMLADHPPKEMYEYLNNGELH